MISHFLMSFCNWADFSFFGAGVRNSAWLFPCIEIFHLLALGILGGTVLLVNARLLGLRFTQEPVAELAKDVEPWMYLSLGLVLVSGFFLFSSESLKMYDNPRVPHQDGCAPARRAVFLHVAPEGNQIGRKPSSGGLAQVGGRDFSRSVECRRARWAGYRIRSAIALEPLRGRRWRSAEF